MVFKIYLSEIHLRIDYLRKQKDRKVSTMIGCFKKTFYLNVTWCCYNPQPSTVEMVAPHNLKSYISVSTPVFTPVFTGVLLGTESPWSICDISFFILPFLPTSIPHNIPSPTPIPHFLEWWIQWHVGSGLLRSTTVNRIQNCILIHLELRYIIPLSSCSS